MTAYCGARVQQVAYKSLKSFFSMFSSNSWWYLWQSFHVQVHTHDAPSCWWDTSCLGHYQWSTLTALRLVSSCRLVEYSNRSSFTLELTCGFSWRGTSLKTIFRFFLLIWRLLGKSPRNLFFSSAPIWKQNDFFCWSRLSLIIPTLSFHRFPSNSSGLPALCDCDSMLPNFTTFS